MSCRPVLGRSIFSLKMPLAFVFLLLLVFSLVMLSQPAPAYAVADYYVSTGGDDTHTCTSVFQACRTITAALDKASNGQGISVGPGTYTENITITKSIFISGAGTDSTIIDGNGTGRVVKSAGNYTVSLSSLTVRNGHTSSADSEGNGGGIFLLNGRLNLINVDVVSNTVDIVGTCSSHCGGGGIYNYMGTVTMVNGTVGWNHGQSGAGILNTGTLNLSGVVIAHNEGIGSSGWGAGIYGVGDTTLDNVTVRNNNAPQSAGGIRNRGSMTITHSAINHNIADVFGGVENISTGGWMTMTNSTVSSNTAVFGGGIGANGAGLLLNSVTIAANQAPYVAGISIASGSGLSIYNTIISNSGENCDNQGTAVSHGYNLISDASCASVFTQPGDVANTNPLLSPLSNWGGTTQTHGLMPGSPALNRRFMSPADPYACTTTDQRSVARPYGSYCDIGAFEGVLNALNLPLIKKQ